MIGGEVDPLVVLGVLSEEGYARRISLSAIVRLSRILRVIECSIATEDEVGCHTHARGGKGPERCAGHGGDRARSQTHDRGPGRVHRASDRGHCSEN